MCETKSFTLWVLQVVLLLGLLVFFLWLSLRPKQPTYTIVQFSVPTPDNGNSTNSTLNQNLTVSFELEIANPNKDSGIYFEETLLTIYYDQDTLGQKTLSSFHQTKDETTHVSDRLNADGKVWKKLVNAISNSTSELKVAALTKIRYRIWGHTSKHQGINLNGKLEIGSDGKISGKSKKIKLHHNSKKWRKRLI